MRVILDTNVLVSGVFFKGPPFNILQIWKKRQIELVISHEILEEYRRVLQEVSVQFPQIDISDLFEIITLKSHSTLSLALQPQICEDRDDDKFFSAALASKTAIIVSGDKHLLDKSGFSGINVEGYPLDSASRIFRQRRDFNPRLWIAQSPLRRAHNSTRNRFQPVWFSSETGF